MTSSAAERDRLLVLLAPAVQSAGYEIDDLTVSSVGRRAVVRLTVDRDGGVDLDAVADVSRAVSDVLDADDAFARPFVLEVSSPGVDRPLTEPRHWRRARRRLVCVPVDGVPVTGRVVEVSDDTGVRLDVDGTRLDVAWPRLGAGQAQVEFTRPDPAQEA